jgi:hypothetical protein
MKNLWLVQDERGECHSMTFEEARGRGWTHERIDGGHKLLYLKPREVSTGVLVPGTYPGRRW